MTKQVTWVLAIFFLCGSLFAETRQSSPKEGAARMGAKKDNYKAVYRLFTVDPSVATTSRNLMTREEDRCEPAGH